MSGITIRAETRPEIGFGFVADAKADALAWLEKPVLPSVDGAHTRSHSLYFADYRDNILTGNSRKNAYYGFYGNDGIKGMGGADVLFGEAGNDRLSGGAGNDSLHGGDGNDRIDGGAGTDTAYFTGSRKANVNLSVTGAQNTGQGRDVLVSIENAVGGSAADRLTGNGTANALLGNAGHDRLDGLGGDDILSGGLGQDHLVGGEGADSFVFDTALGRGNVDTIADFTGGQDRICLARSIFKALPKGGLSPEAFVEGPGAGDAADRIVYDPATGSLSYDADGTGTKAPVKFAGLSAGLNLNHESFLIYA